MVNNEPPSFISGSASLGHADERVARDVHRHQESVARAVGDAAMQILAWREGNRVQGDVELAPGFLDRLENRFELSRGCARRRGG
jgi:hypothetical protein